MNLRVPKLSGLAEGEVRGHPATSPAAIVNESQAVAILAYLDFFRPQARRAALSQPRYLLTKPIPGITARSS